MTIGDLHGDLEKTKRAFRACELTDSNDKWIGGKTTVVQVGDQLDRGPDLSRRDVLSRTYRRGSGEKRRRIS